MFVILIFITGFLIGNQTPKIHIEQKPTMSQPAPASSPLESQG